LAKYDTKHAFAPHAGLRIVFLHVACTRLAHTSHPHRMPAHGCASFHNLRPHPFCLCASLAHLSSPRHPFRNLPVVWHSSLILCRLPLPPPLRIAHPLLEPLPLPLRMAHPLLSSRKAVSPLQSLDPLWPARGGQLEVCTLVGQLERSAREAHLAPQCPITWSLRGAHW